eukprot:2723374-Karenia_brevis.AAC.1
MHGELREISRFLRLGSRKRQQLISSMEEHIGALTKHFETVLNVSRQVCWETIHSLPVFDNCKVDWAAPSLKELLDVIKSLKHGKAADLMGVQCELLQHAVIDVDGNPTEVALR